MNKNTHVYCTNCKYGKILIKSIINDTNLPNECKNCNPYNPEDSCRYEERPNYIEDISPILKIGDKVYRPAWHMNGIPFIEEEEIINYRYSIDGSISIYVTKKGGFSPNSIGKNVYLTKEEVKKEFKRINEEYPNGLPKATTSRHQK